MFYRFSFFVMVLQCFYGNPWPCRSRGFDSSPLLSVQNLGHSQFHWGPHQQPPKKTSNFQQAWHLGEQTNHNKSPNFWNSPATWKYHVSLCGYECNAVAACRQASETKLHHREELEPKRAPRSFLATWMDKTWSAESTCCFWVSFGGTF